MTADDDELPFERYLVTHCVQRVLPSADGRVVCPEVGLSENCTYLQRFLLVY